MTELEIAREDSIRLGDVIAEKNLRIQELEARIRKARNILERVSQWMARTFGKNWVKQELKRSLDALDGR